MEVMAVQSTVITEDQIKGSQARQTIASLTVSLGMVTFGYVTGWLCPTVELFLSHESPVPMTATEVSWVMGAGPLGAIFGSLPSGLLMSHLGRRGTLMLLNVLPVLSWILTYCATSYHLLLTARVLAGSWIGTCYTIIPNYIGEVVEPDLRSSLNTLPCFMHRLGTLVVFTVGAYSSYWILSLVGFILGVLYWIALLAVPESPYYYLIINKEEKAVKSLKWLQNNVNTDDKILDLRRFVHTELEDNGSVFGLLTNHIYLTNLIKVSLATVLAGASGGILISILPILIPKHSIPYLNNKECSIVGAIVSFSFSYRPKCLTLGSNKRSLIISGTVCGICMATMAGWYYFGNKSVFVKFDLSWVPLVSYLIHIVFYSLYIYPISLGLRGEMFPTKFKSSLSAFVSTVATLTIFGVLHSFIPIETQFGIHFNFIIGSVSCFSLVLLTHFFLMETEGKSLQDIQRDLKSSTRVS